MNICLFDMDDTLYDYLGQLRQDLELIRSPTDPPLPPNLWTDLPPWLRRRILLITSRPGWWLKLPKYRLGWDLYETAVEIGYAVEILTKGPSENFYAWAEKAERISKDLGKTAVANIVGKSKQLYYGRVLVDDYPRYVSEWLAHRPRGLAILPAQAYNAEFSHPNAIRYDGTNMKIIADAMRRAFDRKPGEHWRAA